MDHGPKYSLATVCGNQDTATRRRTKGRIIKVNNPTEECGANHVYSTITKAKKWVTPSITLTSRGHPQSRLPPPHRPRASPRSHRVRNGTKPRQQARIPTDELKEHRNKSHQGEIFMPNFLTRWTLLLPLAIVMTLALVWALVVRQCCIDG